MSDKNPSQKNEETPAAEPKIVTETISVTYNGPPVIANETVVLEDPPAPPTDQSVPERTVEEFIPPEEMKIREIVFKAPGADSPGFLRRMMTILEFQSAIERKELDIKIMRRLMKFILDYVDEPKDQGQALLIIEDFSENEFMKALSVIGGGGEESPRPTNGAS